MGADGHIMIYDLDKILQEIDEADINKLLNSVVYKQEMAGKKYLTYYYGDNLFFDGKSWDENFGGARLEQRLEPWFMYEHEFNRCWKIIEKHFIASWEVWT